MDHLIDEYVDLLGDKNANGKAVITPTGDESVYPVHFDEKVQMYVPICKVPEGFKEPVSYGKDKSSE